MQTAGDRDRKFRIALALYAALALLSWFTLGEGHVMVFGRAMEMRVVPVFVLGMFAFRTVMAHAANRIRHNEGPNGAGESEREGSGGQEKG